MKGLSGPSPILWDLNVGKLGINYKLILMMETQCQFVFNSVHCYRVIPSYFLEYLQN